MRIDIFGRARGIGVLLFCFLIILSNIVNAETSAGDATQEIQKQLNVIQQQLLEMRKELDDYSGRLEKIEASIPPPRIPEKLTVELGDAPIFGNPNAKVGIVEFSDYQCPFCRRFHIQTFPLLQKAYIDSGKAIFAVRNFPLNFHAHAMGAAQAVNCARQQNIKAFWDIQGEFFTHQNRLGKDFYMDVINRYGLDQKKFSDCMDEEIQKHKIEEDQRYARSLRVNGTPTFFIGRLEGRRLVDAVRIVGAQPYSAFTPILDSLTESDSAKNM